MTVNLYCFDEITFQYVLVDTVVTDVNGTYRFVDIDTPSTCHINVVPTVDGNDNYVFPEEGAVDPETGNSDIILVSPNTNEDGWDVGMVSSYCCSMEPVVQLLWTLSCLVFKLAVVLDFWN